MKFVIKEAGSREFYDELLYVAAQRRNISKGKKLKQGTISGFYKKKLILGLFGMAFVAGSWLLFRDAVFVILLIMMALLTAIVLYYLKTVNKSVDSLMDTSGERTVEIDAEGVKFTDESKSLDYRWDDIMKIVIGEHSVSFLPVKENEFVIALEDRYKDEILSVLKENGLLDKTVGNI